MKQFEWKRSKTKEKDLQPASNTNEDQDHGWFSGEDLDQEYTVFGIEKMVQRSDLAKPDFFKRNIAIAHHAADAFWWVGADWDIVPAQTKERYLESMSHTRELTLRPENNYYISAYLRYLIDNFRNLSSEVTQAEQIVPLTTNRYMRGLRISADDGPTAKRIAELDHELRSIVSSDEYKNARRHDESVYEYKTGYREKFDNEPEPVEITPQEQKIISRARAVEDELDSLFTTPVDALLRASDRTYTRMTTEERRQSVKEYNFFMSKALRLEVEKDLNIHMRDYSIPEQYSLLTFLESRINQTVRRVREFSDKYGKDGFRTFLAIEHAGQEFGDVILDLSERLGVEAGKNLFAQYALLIDRSENLKMLLADSFDRLGESDARLVQKIPLEIHDALMLRAKDILLGTSKITQESDESASESALVAIEGLNVMMDVIINLFEPRSYDVVKEIETRDNHGYLFKNLTTGEAYRLKLFMRERAEKNAQARINIELSFDTETPDLRLQQAFRNKIVSHKQGKEKDASVLRIGIDREDHGNDPRVSLDIGRAEHHDESLSRTGDVLGNLLAKSSASSNHTTESFSPEFAEAETFARLVGMLRDALVRKSS